MRTLRFREISNFLRSQLVTGLGSRVCGTPAPASLLVSMLHLYHSLLSLCIQVDLVKHHSLPLYFPTTEKAHANMTWVLTPSKPGMQGPCSFITQEGECQRSLASVHLDVKWAFPLSGVQGVSFTCLLYLCTNWKHLTSTQFIIMNNFMCFQVFRSYMEVVSSLFFMGWMLCRLPKYNVIGQQAWGTHPITGVVAHGHFCVCAHQCMDGICFLFELFLILHQIYPTNMLL